MRIFFPTIKHLYHAEREANLQGHDLLVRLKNRHRHRILLCRESRQSTRRHQKPRRSQPPQPNPSRVYPSANPWTRKGLISLRQKDTITRNKKNLLLKWPEEQTHHLYFNNFCRLLSKRHRLYKTLGVILIKLIEQG